MKKEKVLSLIKLSKKTLNMKSINEIDLKIYLDKDTYKDVVQSTRTYHLAIKNLKKAIRYTERSLSKYNKCDDDQYYNLSLFQKILSYNTVLILCGGHCNYHLFYVPFDTNKTHNIKDNLENKLNFIYGWYTLDNSQEIIDLSQSILNPVAMEVFITGICLIYVLSRANNINQIKFFTNALNKSIKSLNNYLIKSTRIK